MSEFTRFVILLTSVPEVPRTIEHARSHVAYLKSLDFRGQLVLAGPFTDFKGGMVIVKAKSLEEACQIAEQDPFVQAGVSRYEARTWELSCEENNHLGLG